MCIFNMAILNSSVVTLKIFHDEITPRIHLSLLFVHGDDKYNFNDL